MNSCLDCYHWDPLDQEWCCAQGKETAIAHEKLRLEAIAQDKPLPDCPEFEPLAKEGDRHAD